MREWRESSGSRVRAVRGTEEQRESGGRGEVRRRIRSENNYQKKRTD